MMSRRLGLGWNDNIDDDDDAGYASEAQSHYDGIDESLIEQLAYEPEPEQRQEPEVIEIFDSEDERDVPGRPPSRAESVYEGIDDSLILEWDENSPFNTQNSNTSTFFGKSSQPDVLMAATNVLGKRTRGVSDLPAASGSAYKVQKTSTVRDDYIIAYDPRVERLLTTRYIGHGLRYELARFISSVEGASYEDITDSKIQELVKMKRKSSSRIDAVLCGERVDKQEDEFGKLFSAEYEATSPWNELRKEEAALAKDPNAGIGNNPAMPGWYGGQVVFRAHLVDLMKKGKKTGKAKKKNYKMELEPCTLGPSSRFTRQHGSGSFLRVRISDAILYDSDNGLEEFFKKRFILWDRVYRAVYAKEGTVFLFWTNEKYMSSARIPNRKSFEEFLTWSNPLSENSQQLMTKWAARTALGFSNSVPGPVIRQENIYAIDDILSPDGKSEMTDGCGLSSKNIHHMIANQLDLHLSPTAFQFRLAGFKGMMSFRNDTIHDGESRVWVRPSQTKIKFPEALTLPQSLRTIDILRTSHLRTGTRLSTEVIINLHENGVSSEFFINLMKKNVRDLIESFTKWDGPNAMLNLAVTVFRAEHVTSGRRAREAKGEARARGFSNRSLDDNGDDDGDDEILDAPMFVEKSNAWWADVVSGCPSSLGETALALIFSGFTPQKCPVLRHKLKKILDASIGRVTSRMRFEITQSCSAFAIPDPYGVLGENEIHVKSSRPSFTLDDEMKSDILVGEVLVTRNPCKVPSDTRKVKAVDHPMLHQHTDVVVFSTKGDRRLIDFLAGGDYDGDTVIVFWDKEIVDPFINADERFSHEPAIVDGCFTRDKEQGHTFLVNLECKPDEESRINAFQNYLLGALRSTSLVGRYSNLHDRAIYKYGYKSDEAHEMAAKFCRVLDSPKTGYRIRPGVLKSDEDRVGPDSGPNWKKVQKESNTNGKNKRQDTSNLAPTQRPKELGSFIMDDLIIFQTKDTEWGCMLREKDNIFSDAKKAEEDQDLAQPWRRMNSEEELSRGPAAFVELKKHDVALISNAVKETYHKWERVVHDNRGKEGFTSYSITSRQDKLREISRDFAASPRVEELVTFKGDEAALRRIRASCAYNYDREQSSMRWSQFPFNAALRELCLIKCQASGQWMPFLDEFSNKMTVDQRFRRHE